MTKGELKAALSEKEWIEAFLEDNKAGEVNGYFQKIFKAAENWLMVLEMEPSQTLRRNWQEDPHAYKWIATDRRGQPHYDDRPEEALQKAIID